MRSIPVVLVSVLVAAAVVAEDSPLVAAAKRTNRKASKTPVITNAKLSKSKARLTTASDHLAALPEPTAAPAAPKKETAEPTATRVVPSALPTTARAVAPESSARTVAPTSGAQNFVPQSTSQTVAPQSTAQTITPQAATPTPRSQQ